MPRATANQSYRRRATTRNNQSQTIMTITQRRSGLDQAYKIYECGAHNAHLSVLHSFSVARATWLFSFRSPRLKRIS